MARLRHQEVSLIQQLGVPDYRLAFFESLLLNNRIALVTGQANLDSTLPDHSAALPRDSCRYRKNVAIAGGRLVWQTGVRDLVGNRKKVILSGNPRIVSNWLVVAARRMLGRRTLFWGHLKSRRGRISWLRRLFLGLSNGLVLYTHGELKASQQLFTSKELYVAPNAVLKADSMHARALIGRDFLMLGRLIEEKGPRRVLAAFEDLVERGGYDDVRLHVVGDGPLLEELRARSHPVRVKFYGHLPMGPELQDICQNCVAAVNGGYVGLSALDTLSQGLVNIFAPEFEHAPEVEIFAETNSVQYARYAPLSLADAMQRVLDEQARWAEQRSTLSQYAREAASVEAMVRGMTDALLLEPVAGV